MPTTNGVGRLGWKERRVRSFNGHLVLQLALREALAGKTADDLIATRTQLGPVILEGAAGALAKLGVELLSVDVRDLMVSAELKRIFAGVVAARKEGEAALERARGETAALRSLANAARMLEDNPGLVQLRMLQEIGASSGNTIMLGVPDGIAAARSRPRPGRSTDVPPTTPRDGPPAR